jgi:Uncharacterized protein conserved in bacteria
MRRKRVILALLGVLLIAVVIPRQVDSNTTVDAGYGRLQLRGYAIAVPFLPFVELGRWTAHYESGSLGKETIYFFGFPQIYREYFPDGTLMSEGRFRRGWAEGDWRSFHPNGMLAVVNIFEVGRAWPIAQRIYSAAGELIFHAEGEKVLVDKLEMVEEQPNQ